MLPPEQSNPGHIGLVTEGILLAGLRRLAPWVASTRGIRMRRLDGGECNTLQCIALQYQRGCHCNTKSPFGCQPI
jgi:hypothetical protein